MQHRTYRLLSIIVAVMLALGSFINVSAKDGTQSISLAAGTTYFVSISGNDSNAGTASAPFKTFAKAISMLAAGDELQIYGGTYTQQLNVTKSGTSSAPISIKAVPGQQVVFDGGGSNDMLILVPDATSYVNLSGLTCKRASVVCVLLRGTYITVSNFEVSDAKKFGIRLTGSYITVENSRIHDNVLENLGGTNTSGGWGAALRSAQETGGYNTFRFNEVYHNWGEGIIMGSNHSLVYGNHVYDNFSKNIYIGNTYNVDVYQNVTHSTDSKWYRSGSPADCISLSEESISSTYGAKLGNVRVFNNIASNCKTGVGYTYSQVSGNGCNNCLFTFNTITASKSACIKVISGSKNHIEIANNICSTGSISIPSGDISVHHNFLGDPRLTGGAISDPNAYRPQSDSPVIGAGVNVGVNVDFFDTSRSRFDEGAIQAGVSVQSIPTATLLPPTPTLVVPTTSATQIPPTPTVVQPTATLLLPTPTLVVPTASATQIPPTPTVVQPTATLPLPTATVIVRPTNTAVPPVSVPGSSSLDVRVSSGPDDVEERADGSMYVNSSDIELVHDASDQIIGLRFNSIKIPRGAVITNAYVQFTVDEASSGTTPLIIHGQLSPNAAVFTTASKNASSRPMTTKSVNWSPVAWPSVGAKGADQRTPNLAAITQEIVNQTNWTSGNSLVLIITGSGKRVAKAYEGDAAGAALLHIEFTPAVLPTATLPLPTATILVPPTGTALPSDTPMPTDMPSETPSPAPTDVPTETPSPTPVAP